MNYSKIKKNTDFQRLFKKGKRVFSPYMTLIYLPSDKLGMGVAVSKKHGKAVVRNRIKRLLRAAFSQACKELEKSYSVIIIPKVLTEYVYSDYLNGLSKAFKRINSCEN